MKSSVRYAVLRNQFIPVFLKGEAVADAGKAVNVCDPFCAKALCNGADMVVCGPGGEFQQRGSKIDVVPPVCRKVWFGNRFTHSVTPSR